MCSFFKLQSQLNFGFKHGYQKIINTDINNDQITMVVNSRDTVEDAELKMLSRDVNIKTLDRCIKQYKLRNIFKHRILSECKNNNSKSYKRAHVVRQYHFNKSPSARQNDPVPRHARTRHATMQIVEWNGISFIMITCDCGCMCRERHVCRHAHCVLNEKPCLDHFHPKCYKSYFNFVHRNVECTNMIDEYDDLFRLKKGLIFNVNKYNGCVKIICSFLSVLFILTLNHIFKDFYHHLVCIPRTLMKIGS